MNDELLKLTKAITAVQMDVTKNWPLLTGISVPSAYDKQVEESTIDEFGIIDPETWENLKDSK